MCASGIGQGRTGRAMVSMAVAALALGSPMVARAQDPSPGAGASAAPPAAQFSARLTAVQQVHDASLLNVKYDRPNQYCKNGLLSYSTDQTVTFTSDPVAVDVVKLETPPEGWGDQVVFLVPRGQSVADVTFAPPSDFLFDVVAQVELPGMAAVDRTYAKPGTGQLPDAMPFDVTCTGGDGPGGVTPTPLDCGSRQLAMSLGLFATAPGKVQSWATQVDPSAQGLYANCTGADDLSPGQFMGNEDVVTVVTRTDADIPAAAQLLDAAVPTLSLTGGADGVYRDAGSLIDTHMTWTLTLCRLDAGTPAC
jgi:hypothetical protein